MGCQAVIAWPYPLNVAQSAPPAEITIGLMVILIAVLVVFFVIGLLIVPVLVLLVVRIVVLRASASNGIRDAHTGIPDTYRS